ncbi:YodC family protein [Acinetobacter sp.]|uniref:YodC family protein n=1 Tax=Acinetobacter sp. TaxID=472 RepID=UPI0035B4C11D
MSNYKIGDVVQLKSGGPTMTVSETNDAGMVLCTWFDAHSELQEQAFNQELIKPYKKATQVGII